MNIYCMKKQTIRYGKFTNSTWQTINGLASVEHVIARIKDEIDWKCYSLWVHGSILNDVDTHDIDLTIMGVFIPQRINQLLEAIVKIGFQEQVYCDVKFSISNQLYDPTKDSVKTIRYACYQPKIQFDDATYTAAESIGGLYVKEVQFPMPKTIGKTMREGFVYKRPLRLV